MANVYPLPSGVAPYTSQPPANASSVLWDGQLVTMGTYSTTITGTGAPWFLYANGASGATFIIGGTQYVVPAGAIVGTAAMSGSKSVSVYATTTGVYKGSPITGGTLPTAFSTTGVSSIAYGNGVWVATTGYNSGTGGTATRIFAYSKNNGTTWTQGYLPYQGVWMGGPGGGQGVNYGFGYFVACASGGSAATTYAYSANGINWTQGTLPAGGPWWNVLNTGSALVMVHWSGGGVTNTNMISTNGTTWTATAKNPGTGSGGFLTCWGGGNGYIVCISNNGQSWYSNNNTATWNSISSGTVSQQVGMIAVTAIGAVGAAIFPSSYAATASFWQSTSPTIWTTVTLPSVAGGVCYAVNGTFYLNGMTSTNGTTWTVNGSVLYNAVALGGPSNNILVSGSSYVLNSVYTLPVAYGIYNGPTATH